MFLPSKPISPLTPGSPTSPSSPLDPVNPRGYKKINKTLILITLNLCERIVKKTHHFFPHDVMRKKMVKVRK